MNIFSNIRIALFAYAILLFLTLLSCSGKKASPLQTQPVPYNQITRKVCKADTSQSYEVYLPTIYNNQKKWPVIFAFDPHADGKLAVEHFKVAAERFGYVIVGSNNSKNGLQTLDHTLDILINDVKKEFSIDGNRKYAAGFSGGGRVASYLATKTGNINGIITCGAGLSRFDPQAASSRFDIYAIAGREDFNHDEVMEIPQQLDRTGWRYIAIGFDGGHDWPSAYLITNAVQWFQFNAMKDELIPKDEQLLEQEFDSTLARCESNLDKGQYLRAADECRIGIASFNGLVSLKKLNKKLEEIENLDRFRAEKQKELQAKYEEQQLRKAFLESFSTRDLDWWVNELKNLSDKTSNEQDVMTRQMYKRMKGFLGIVCYSYTAQAITENNVALAEKCLGIYEIVEPKNPDCFFYKAQLLDRKNKHSEAADALKKAMEFGFKDMAKIKGTFSDKVLQLALKK